jgi:phytanoyl-CoA hydroxylase
MLAVIVILRVETKHESARNSLSPLKAKKQFFTKVRWALNIAILAASIDKTRREKMNGVEHVEERSARVRTPAQEYYEANGYYVWRNLVPSQMIDRLLDRFYKDIVPSTYPFFRQNTDRYEANKLTPHGYIQQSFLDIHDYKKFPEFSQCAKEIYTSREMCEALRDITGFDSFKLMQTMLFDANTETQSHQDCWYLDSVPNGHLLAGWIALEDIDERAGRFYVVPKSQLLDFQSDTPGLEHDDWIARIKNYVARNPEQVHAPALKKGDVLFWNSHTIHGALPTQDPRLSRKSLTAHYLPSEFKFGNLFLTKENLHYKSYNGMQYFRTRDDIPFDKLKADIKESALYSPTVMQVVRKVQNVFK